jgi:hypothetical protein
LNSNASITDEIEALSHVEEDPDSLRFVSDNLINNDDFLTKVQQLYSKKQGDITFVIKYQKNSKTVYTGFLMLENAHSYGKMTTTFLNGTKISTGLWKENKLVEGTIENDDEIEKKGEANVEEAFNQTQYELKQKMAAGDVQAAAQYAKNEELARRLEGEARKEFIKGVGGDISAFNKTLITLE